MNNHQNEQNANRSTRSRAFLAFDLGTRPARVAKMLNAKPTTIYRYHQQWKKLPPSFQIKYKAARKLYNKLSYSERSAFVKLLAARLGGSEEEVQALMIKPWALRQIVTGEWKQWPVSRTHPILNMRLNTWLRGGLLVLRSQEARNLLKLADDQEINPLENQEL